VAKETVKLAVCIRINVDRQVDTGWTVEQWNSFTDTERATIAKEWEQRVRVGAGNSEVTVSTEGAEEL
jgi:hypothetical protein